MRWRNTASLPKQYGLQVVTHVIGDAAIEKTIDCYENAFVDGENKLRHAPDPLPDYGRRTAHTYRRKGHPGLCTAHFPGLRYEYRRGTLRQKSWHRHPMLLAHCGARGAHISYGTDCPVEDCNPFPNIYMAVTRKDKSGQPAGGFYPGECVDVAERYRRTPSKALTASSWKTAREDQKGYYADLVLLDRDTLYSGPDGNQRHPAGNDHGRRQGCLSEINIISAKRQST